MSSRTYICLVNSMLFSTVIIKAFYANWATYQRVQAVWYLTQAVVQLLFMHLRKTHTNGTAFRWDPYSTVFYFHDKLQISIHLGSASSKQAKSIIVVATFSLCHPQQEEGSGSKRAPLHCAVGAAAEVLDVGLPAFSRQQPTCLMRRLRVAQYGSNGSEFTKICA